MKVTNILGGDFNLTVENINDSIRSYLQTYCFSTLDIALSKNKILSLDLENLYEKIVVSRRGGYCFEHNKLFYHSLISVGAAVRSQLARVVYGKDIDAPRTHRVSVVTLDEVTYLADVGFGAYTPDSLVPMNESEIICPNGYKYRILINDLGIYSLQMLNERGFFTLYSFELDNCYESDFNLGSYYSNTHPNSKHANNLIITLNGDNKIYTLLNRSFVKFIDGEKFEEDITSFESLRVIIKKFFKIVISSEEARFLFEKFR